MPKYQNRSGEIVTIGEFVWAPFEIREIKRNLFIRSPIVMIDSEPKYIPYEIIIPNGSTESEPFLHQHSKIIRLDSGNFPNDDNFYNSSSPSGSGNGNAKIGVFVTVGPPEVKADYHLNRIIRFINNNGKWMPENPGDDRLPQHLIDIEYEVVYLKILEGSGLEVSIKPY